MSEQTERENSANHETDQWTRKHGEGRRQWSEVLSWVSDDPSLWAASFHCRLSRPQASLPSLHRVCHPFTFKVQTHLYFSLKVCPLILFSVIVLQICWTRILDLLILFWLSQLCTCCFSTGLPSGLMCDFLFFCYSYQFIEFMFLVVFDLGCRKLWSKVWNLGRKGLRRSSFMCGLMYVDLHLNALVRWCFFFSCQFYLLFVCLVFVISFVNVYGWDHWLVCCVYGVCRDVSEHWACESEASRNSSHS